MFNVEIITESGCWIWMASVNACGYGLMNINGRTVSAHRTSYEAFVGPIPQGLHLDHLCRVRCCINPTHLEPVTSKENCQRSARCTATHCRYGHEFTPENTFVFAAGKRSCKECARKRAREYQRRKSASAH